MKKLLKNFAFILLLSALLGLAVGVIFGESAQILQPLGMLFTRLLFMVVPAIVFFSIASSFANIGNVKTLSRWAGKTVGWFIMSTIIGTLIGTFYGILFKPGKGLSIPDAEISLTKITADTFLQWIPNNAFGSLAAGDIIQIVFLSMFVGIAVIFMKNVKHKEVMRTVLNTGQDLFLTIIKGIMYYAPIGIFSLMASSIGDLRGSILSEMGTFILAITLAFVTHIILVYFLMFWKITKLNPFKFLKMILPALLTAFSTTSSAATMPLTLQGVKDAGVDEEIADFGVPLGVTFNMDSMAIQIPIYIMLGMFVSGVTPNIAQLILFCLMGVVFSIGTAGVPGGGLAVAAILVNAFGLPVAIVGLISSVFFYLDVTGTTINIWGDAVCVAMVAKTEGKLDASKFNANKVA